MSEIDLQIGFADAMTKLNWGVWDWNDAGGGLADEIAVTGARNEVVGVQVRLSSPHDFVLTLDRANWLHPLGFCPRVRLDVRFPSLPAEAVEVLAVGYVEGDDRRQWMKYLDRAGYAQVPAYRPQAVAGEYTREAGEYTREAGEYVRIRIPADLDAGVHEGHVTAYAQYGFEDEESIWQGTVRLHVADVTLPDVADWSFHLNLWQH